MPSITGQMKTLVENFEEAVIIRENIRLMKLPPASLVKQSNKVYETAKNSLEEALAYVP